MGDQRLGPVEQALGEVKTDQKEMLKAIQRIDRWAARQKVGGPRDLPDEEGVKP
jgi:hypothetical protein